MKVKGNIVKARVNFVKAQFGEGAWEKVLNSCSEEDRNLLGGIITNSAWFPFDVAERLDTAIVEVLGGGQTRVFDEIGRASARENLGGVHKGMLTPGDPEAFMKKADMIYKFYYDVGHREYEPTGPNSGILTTYNAETFSTADCATVVGWYREGLAMCGASSVEITEEECRARGGQCCRYVVKWE